MIVSCIVCDYTDEVNPGSGCFTTKKVYKNPAKIWICDYCYEEILLNL